jgi:predicted glycosyltransferase
MTLILGGLGGCVLIKKIYGLAIKKLKGDTEMNEFDKKIAIDNVDWASVARKINGKYQRILPYTVDYLKRVWRNQTTNIAIKKDLKKII